MTFINAAEIQTALYDCLVADVDIQRLVGGHIYDALPSGTTPDLFISLGAEKIQDASDSTGGGSIHDLNVSVIAEKTGFLEAKQVSHAIGEALLQSSLSLPSAKVAYIHFVHSNAYRETDSHTRRIDMQFRLRADYDIQ